jgi:hypothetical protein
VKRKSGGSGRSRGPGESRGPGGSDKPESPARALAEFLQPYDPSVRALALGLRKLVISEVAPCQETLFRTSYTVAFLYSASARVSESFCHISVHRQHVNLAFMRGSLLPDPNGLLEGDGAWMRHIHVKIPADLERPELRSFVRAACAEADHMPSGGRVTSIVKRGKAFKGQPARRSSIKETKRAKAGPR